MKHIALGMAANIVLCTYIACFNLHSLHSVVFAVVMIIVKTDIYFYVHLHVAAAPIGARTIIDQNPRVLVFM